MRGLSPNGDCPTNRRGVRTGSWDSRRGTSLLLELDGRSGLFELGLDRVGLVLGQTFLDRVGRAVDEVLRFLEAEAGDGADDLDHLDLLAAGLGQHDVERRLLLGRGSAVTAGRRSAGGGNRNRRGGRHAPLLLELVLELDQVEDGHAPEFLDQLVRVCLGHYSSCPSSFDSCVGSSAGGSTSAVGSVAASGSASL